MTGSQTWWINPGKWAAVPVAACFMSVAWLAVVVRIWTRGFIVRSLGWDDITMLIAMAFFTVFCSSQITALSYTHSESFHTWKGLVHSINFLIVSEVFYLVTVLVLKISLGIFYLRVLVKPWARQLVYASMAISSVWNLACTIFVIFQCGYPESAMVVVQRALAGKCVSVTTDRGFGYSQAAVTTITDFIYATLPLLIVRGAGVDKREKITGSVCSVVRFMFVGDLVFHNPMKFFGLAIDEASNIGIWSTIEPGAGIIAASLATLRPLLRKCRGLPPTALSTVNDDSPTNSNLPQTPIFTRPSSCPPRAATPGGQSGKSGKSGLRARVKEMMGAPTSGDNTATEGQFRMFYYEPKTDFEWSDQQPPQPPATSGGEDDIEETTATMPQVHSKMAEDMV